MFTGLIETVCRVRSLRGAVLEVDLGELAGQLKPADSVAINGVCLTAAGLSAGAAQFDLSGETLQKTTLGRLQPGKPVNIELALKADGRLGGHFVQGHVDGIATVVQIQRKADFADVKFAADAELLDQMVPKGSVAVDGVSLTVADMGAGWFCAAIIPVTLERTTLGQARVGDKVNIETDIIVKIIKRQLDKLLGQRQGLTAEKLKELGF